MAEFLRTHQGWVNERFIIHIAGKVDAKGAYRVTVQEGSGTDWHYTTPDWLGDFWTAKAKGRRD